jgi:hypothetical protein
MGNFYTNYALPGVTQSAVVAALAGRRAIVTPSVNKVVVVFDEQSESQDTAVITALAAELSAKCKCPVLAILNHDDDILWYGLFTDSKLSDEYNSCPDYFETSDESEGPIGGDAAKLAAAFGSVDLEAIENSLRGSDDDYTFAIERHADLANALGLPECVVGGGYNAIEEGEIPAGLQADSLVRTA